MVLHEKLHGVFLFPTLAFDPLYLTVMVMVMMVMMVVMVMVLMMVVVMVVVMVMVFSCSPCSLSTRCTYVRLHVSICRQDVNTQIPTPTHTTSSNSPSDAARNVTGEAVKIMLL
jgi:hypothetical protein